MDGKAYLLLDSEGSPVGLADERETALEMAYLLEPDGNIYLDAPTEQNEVAIAAGEAEDRMALAANAPRHLRVIGAPAKVARAPGDGVKALLFAMVAAESRRRGEDAFDYERSMRMPLADAHKLLRPFFPRTKYTKVDQRRRPVHIYQEPAKMAANLLGQNYKTAKGTPQDIIRTLKEMTGFRKANVLGLSILPTTQSYSDSVVQEIMSNAADLYGIEKFSEVHLNACVRASTQCASSCLVFSGRNLADDYNSVKKYALLSSMVYQPDAFLRMLSEAIRRHRDKSLRAATMPLVRLNVFSDLPWELLAPGLFEHYHDVQFYDYTKVPGRTPPPNYDLTFSFAGTKPNVEAMDYEIREQGRRVAVVFAATQMRRLYKTQWIDENGDAQEYIGTQYKTATSGKPTFEREVMIPKTPKFYRRKAGARSKTPTYARLPEEFLGLPVVDGDVSDMRPYDPSPSIVALRWKHPANQNVTMEQAGVFVVEVDLVQGAGGYYDAIVSKTARFDDVDYEKYAPSNVDE